MLRLCLFVFKILTVVMSPLDFTTDTICKKSMQRGDQTEFSSEFLC